jgi:flagellar motor switch protein FliN/FliY
VLTRVRAGGAPPAPVAGNPLAKDGDLMADEDVPADPTAPPPGADPFAADPAAGDAVDPLASFDQASIDELLKQASFDDPNAVAASGDPADADAAAAMAMDPMAALAAAGLPIDASELKLPNFQQVMQDAQVSSIDLLRDVELNVKIELGRSRMLVEDVLKLSEGSVVELDKLAGDPVDVFVNDKLVARGEVLVLNDNFCVRVNEIVAAVKEEGL